MSLVRAKDTKPELIVRRIVRSMKIGHSLHANKLVGSPDLAFWRRKKVIFVHGCFWHRHRSKTCWRSRLPKSRPEFWIPKLESNRLRDQRNQRALKRDGWKILVVWECQLSNKERLENKIRRFLEGNDAGYRTVRRSGRTRTRS